METLRSESDVCADNTINNKFIRFTGPNRQLLSFTSISNCMVVIMLKAAIRIRKNYHIVLLITPKKDWVCGTNSLTFCSPSHLNDNNIEL